MTTVVPHKYMAGELSDEERAATFAARRDLLDYLVNQMRSQIGCGTLKSFLLTGPRGAGKTTLVHMLRQRIQADPELAAAWLPLVLPEEQTGVSSLRDLLVLILEHLEPAGVPDAAAWWQRAEQEADDELSRALAEDGLRTLAGSQGRRLVVVLENLVSLFERALGEDQQSTLRRLLMHEPFMLLVGTAVGTFDDLERYDRAFWKYFEPLRLEPLSDDDVHALLTRRAEYDGNTGFLQRYHTRRPMIRTLRYLTGGNPRLLMLLYEVVSQRDLDAPLQLMRRLVDEMTPLYNGLLDRLPTQQQKIVDSLMRLGGTATPAAIAANARLQLNKVTGQLKRLVDAQWLRCEGGGKGREANYSMGDQLFCTWYQLRHFRP